MAFDRTRPADLAWLGDNAGAFQNPILPLSPRSPDPATYPQPGQFSMPSLQVPVTELPADPVLAAYLNAVKTPSSAGVSTTSGPATRITYQTGTGTNSKPVVFIVLILILLAAFYYFKKKGAISVG